VFEKPFHEVPGSIERVVDALLDERWPWRPKLMRQRVAVGMTTLRKFKQRIPKNAREELIGALSTPEIGVLELHAAARDDLDDAWLDMMTGREPLLERRKFSVLALCRLEGMPPECPIEGWIEVMHDLVAAVGAVHGILVCEEEEHIVQELYLGLIVRNGVPSYARWREIDRCAGAWIGSRHVRFPRWGTYLRREHVEVVGGRARIAEVVKPAAMRSVGELLFVQLTESPAIHDEVKQAAFTELLAPLLPP
jgi:hypothetical protein